MATQTNSMKRSGRAASQQWSGPARRALLLDIAERLFVLALMTQFLVRLAPMIGSGACNILIAISEGLSAVLILTRRPGTMIATPYAWTIAILGTCAPLTVAPGGAQLVPWTAAATLMAVGLAFSISAKAFLRRSFGILPANRGVQRGGPYGLVRHPMYAGYLLTHAGFLLSSFCLRNVLAYAVCWTAMVLRIRAEEAILSQDPSYRAYCGVVRRRLLPFLW